MSHRLDQERQDKLEPQRMKRCKEELEKLGFTVDYVTHNELNFYYNDNLIKLWPYSGWYSGKGVKSVRGFHNLISQLKGGAKL